jgi:hypothetical protein
MRKKVHIVFMLFFASLAGTPCMGQFATRSPDTTPITRDTTISCEMIIVKNETGYSIYNTSSTIKEVCIIHGNDTMYNHDVDKIHLWTRSWRFQKLYWHNATTMILIAVDNDDMVLKEDKKRILPRSKKS